MKNLIVYCLLIISCFAFTQDENLMFWQSGNKLTWEDFKGKPDKSSPYKALTYGRIKTDVSANSKEAHIIIKTSFDKNKSWVKELRIDNLLAHEQLHFDIIELWARKFRQKLKGKTYTFKVFQSEITTMQKFIYEGADKMQLEYDKETKHAEDKVNQQKWNEQITDEMQKLSIFSEPEVICTISK